jgi:hypothetical protein
MLRKAGKPPIQTGVTNHSLLYEAGARPAYVMAQMGHTSSALAAGGLRWKMERRRDKVGPDTSAGANQAVQLSTPRRVARPPGNAPHGPEHAHELPERLRVGENVRIGIV